MSHKKSVLINPIVSRNIHEAHRPATALELFYDLIYVVAIASVAVQLHHAVSNMHHVWASLGVYLFIFWGIWWPWNTYTWFSSGYDTDDAQFRLASFVQMIGVIIIAVGVKSAFEHSNFLIMMIGFVTMRIPYILLWIKVAYNEPESKTVALRYAVCVFSVQLAWIFCIFYLQSWYAFIALACVEMIIPYFAESAVNKGHNTTYHFEHIEERLGLLTIIVLGESILASVHAVEKVFEHFSFDLLSLVIGSLLLLFSMWWLYFDDKVEHELGKQKKAFIWGYGHYFIYASATAVGAMISVNVDVLTNHASISRDMAVLSLSLAMSVYLLSVWVCHDFLLPKVGIKRYELLILVAFILIIAIVFKSILLMSFAFVSLNIIRLLRRHKQYKMNMIEK
jgi:low temperature requirement protein LtrA